MSGDAAAAQVATQVLRIDNLWQEIIKGVNWVLDKLPGFLEGAIRSGFDKLKNKVNEFFTDMNKLLTERGSADAIRTAGESWNTGVGGKASAQSGLLVPASLETDNEWTGDAAVRYGEAVDKQGKALGSVKLIVDALHTTLNEIASALKTFWTAMLVSVLTYAGAMAAAAVACASVVASPAGIVAAIVASIAVLTATATFTVNLTNTLDEKKAKLDQQTTLEGTFAGGVWPPSVAEQMTDASVTDEDKKSDWTPK